MNSCNGVKNKRLSAEELSRIADRMRAYALIAIYNAKSGHTGGSLSAMDLIAAAYLDKMKHDPSNPNWEERDRFFFSKAHASPATYAALAITGYYDIEEIMSFRKLKSPFQGHPEIQRLKGIEFSGGSLGQGLSVAVGSALAAKIKKANYNVFCLMGDGEQQAGSIWESAMSASNFKLDNLIGIVDKNNLQIDGTTEEVMSLENLVEKYRAFGFHTFEIDGHNMEQILNAYDKAIAFKGKPSVIIANTIKGKGVSFMENNSDWHSKAPDYEQLKQALKELKCEHLPLEKLVQKSIKFGKKIKKMLNQNTKFTEYEWNKKDLMRVEKEATRKAFGRAISEIKNPKVIRLASDSCKSVFRFDYKKFDFDSGEGIINLGIAEQNMTNVAAGLAKEGFIPIIGAYGIFSCGRNWDQLRNTVCAANFNVKIAGVGGLTVGGDGASHQALEELFLTRIPNLKVFVPCDSLETEKITEKMIDVYGPCYIRLGKSDSPIITKKQTPLELGKANIVRFREETKNFADAFDFYLYPNYKSENEDLVIIACGAMVAEAMRAAYILKKEHNLETRILDMHTIKPLDEDAIKKVAQEIPFAITIEEHQIGGLGNLIAKTMMDVEDKKTKRIKMIGIEDRFGESGSPADLIKYFKLNAENIVDVAVRELK